jgi:aspartyl-tRNA(Asn)/glutamyl-tRNA(Gln) amidotransferase subunit A
MGATVKDSALVLEVIAGKDKRDSTSAEKPVEKWSEIKPESLKGLRIGLPREYFAEGLSNDVKKAIESTLEILKSLGASTHQIDLPHTKEGVAVYYIVAPCEASANLSRYDGVRFGYRAKDALDLEDLYKKSRGLGFGPEPKRRIMLGTFALSSGYYDAYYKKACQVRRLIREDFVKAFQTCDIIATPITTGTAFKIGDKSQDPLAMYMNDVFTLPASLAGIPGISVNCGYSQEGLPIGIQFLAPHFEEGRIIGAARLVEENQKAVRRPAYEL